MKARAGWKAAFLLGGLLVGDQARAATVVIKVADEAGAGFNDTTPAAPVGGNPGTTVGEQRRIVFQTAADAWGRLLESPVPIVVEAHFADLSCTSGATTAGSAGAVTISNHPDLPTTGKYPLALANRILGQDILPDVPDIRAKFNSGLKACMDIDWYYGLDGKETSGDVNLLSVVLHELTHGFGFADGIDPDTGAFKNGGSSPFTEHVLDNTNGKHWTEMSNDERKASLAHVRDLVWDGKRVAAVAARLLAKGSPSVQVSPAIDNFSGLVSETNYGRMVADGASITGTLATVTLSACALTDTTFAGVSGKVVLLLAPKGCSIMTLANWAEKNGALAVLTTYGVAGSPPPNLPEASSTLKANYPLSIPTLALTLDDANLLKSAPASTSITVSADANRLVGADGTGHTMIYASNPVRSGATGAHWDPLVRPNLTMEPSETLTPHNSLEMERALLWDIGWTATCGNGVLDGQEECDEGSANSDFIRDACRLDCKKHRCGDGTVDGGEECDPGPVGVSKKTDTNCRPDCTKMASGGTGGSSGSGGSNGKGGSGAGGDSGGTGGGSGGSNGKGGSGAGGDSGGTGGGSGSGGSSKQGGASGSVESSGSGGSGESSGGTSESGGSSGGAESSSGSSRSSRDGKGGGCGCRLTPTSPSGFAVLITGLAFVLGRRRRGRA